MLVAGSACEFIGEPPLNSDFARYEVAGHRYGDDFPEGRRTIGDHAFSRGRRLKPATCGGLQCLEMIGEGATGVERVTLSGVLGTRIAAALHGAPPIFLNK